MVKLTLNALETVTVHGLMHGEYLKAHALADEWEAPVRRHLHDGGVDVSDNLLVAQRLAATMREHADTCRLIGQQIEAQTDLDGANWRWPQ